MSKPVLVGLKSSTTYNDELICHVKTVRGVDGCLTTLEHGAFESSQVEKRLKDSTHTELTADCPSVELAARHHAVMNVCLTEAMETAPTKRHKSS
ncbi:MAG: uncharacterized protein KVP18_004403 [Porospora cf. gigantea A]|uniref:uncharacterized protein n=1 Tax=Porospora cf. gigantea A TaxID=2853593 RepID=UPI00355983E1|nr:MAG: hypothetical protein KVP18_004403 [Porospora cf. gigantea A]